MKLKKVVERMGYYSVSGACIGFFAGLVVNDQRKDCGTPMVINESVYIDLSGFLPFIIAGLGAGIGFSIGIVAAILDFCENLQNENSIINDKPRFS